jgi:hypothetical protein
VFLGTLYRDVPEFGPLVDLAIPLRIFRHGITVRASDCVVESPAGGIIIIGGAAMKPSRTASIYPPVAEINALPEKFRRYIHDLETRCNKSGDVQTIALLREDREALQCLVEELEAQVKPLTLPKDD